MLQLIFFREQKERVLLGFKKRNWSDEDALATVNEITGLDEVRRSTQNELDNTLAESNRLSKQIGDLMRNGQRQEVEAIKSRVAVLKDKSKNLDEKLNTTAESLETILLSLPNIPNAAVPFGKTPDENEVFQAWDKPLPTLPDDALSHWDLSDKLTVFDLDLGVKLTGGGFPVYRGKGAKLVRALIQFFLDQASEAGYEEIVPPLLVNEASARGTGQLPDKEGQMYYVEKDDLYLIPTAEVPITNILRDEILSEKELPVKFCGYTQCFRREAGSYGAHVRGLNRVHQFDKIEIVQFTHPDKSYDTLMEMVNHVKILLEKLELPYRILRLCGGDMGHASAMTFDFEVWSAAQKRWLEVSSVSNFETYQANRLKCRFRDGQGKTQFVHTLNGSALALGRIIAAILENNQTTEGVTMPKALVPYTKFDILD
jgi:seryl-tRNA synthetase